MICKNCSAEYDESLAQCPECGMENETATACFDTKSEEVAKIEEATDESAQVTEQEEEKETQEEAPEAAEEASCESENSEEEQTDEDKNEQDTASAEKTEKTEDKPVLPARRTVRRPVRRVSKEEKRISAGIIATLCLVGVFSVVLSVMNITTDVFRISDSGEKMVVGVGFIPQEENQLEKVLSKCFSVAKKGFGRESTGTEGFIARLNPGDKGNVYSLVNGGTEKVQTEADPAQRFADENGEYAYYKVPEKKIDKVLELFGLESGRGENSENYYYCEGFYYFAVQKAKTTVVAAEVTKSRRILDGSYYVECYFYKESAKETAKSKTCYMIVEAVKDEASGEIDFTVKRISLRPIFGSDGNLLDSAKTWERKSELIEGRTKDGKLFSKYKIEYPVVEGDGAGYKNVRDFFENAVSVYKMKAETADAEYEKFKASGGDEGQLPYVENVVASIVFDDENNISFKGEISKLNPTVKPTTEETEATEEQSGCAKLYERTVEAYTIDKKTGDFVSKDSVIGKDYMLISELLYRIYNGYDYETILPSDEEEDYYSYDETPADTDGQGNAIYESARALTEKGITFYYVTEKGYVSEVTVPYKVVKKLAG